MDKKIVVKKSIWKLLPFIMVIFALLVQASVVSAQDQESVLNEPTTVESKTQEIASNEEVSALDQVVILNSEDVADIEVNDSVDTSDLISDNENLSVDAEKSNLTLFASPETRAVITGSKRYIDIFPDANLALVVAKTIGGMNAKITDSTTQAKLDGLSILSADGITVGNIEGIQYLRNMTKFSIQNSKNVSDLSPFSQGQFDKLSIIYMRNNKITDISPLTGVVPNLKEIYFENGVDLGKYPDDVLGSNSVTDLSALATMPLLEQISAEDNYSVTSLAPLANHTHLQKVYLKNNKITSIEPLKLNTNLRELLIERNNLTSISGVENMSKLTRVSVYDNEHIADISPMKNKPDLLEFWAHNNKIESVEGLRQSTKLVHLTLADNKIRDISPLSGINPSGIYSVFDQTIELAPHEYSILLPLQVHNVIINKNGQMIRDSIVGSLGGTIIGDNVTWNLASGVSEVTYTWNNQTTKFSGTVTIPLVEIEPVKFTVTNEIFDFPTQGSSNIATQNIKFAVTLMSEGRTISPSKNGLSSDGSFVLNKGQSISLLGLEKGTYKLDVYVNDQLYSTVYDRTHGTNVETDVPLSSTKEITGTLSPEPNAVVVKNTYTNWSTLNVTNHFNPSGSTTYSLTLKYPDGTEVTQSIDTVPFNQRYEVGTEFSITQPGLEDFEPRATLYHDQEETTKYEAVGAPLTVSSRIQKGNNTVHFENLWAEELIVSNEDISKYPNIYQQFNYEISLDRTNYQAGMQDTYTVTKYDDANNPIGTYPLNVSGPSLSITINHGESIKVDKAPLEMTYTIKQSGVRTYLTSAKDGQDMTVGIRDNGLEINHIIEEGGNNVRFINESDYKPPITGIISGTNISIGMMLVSIVWMLLYIIQQKRKLTK